MILSTGGGVPAPGGWRGAWSGGSALGGGVPGPGGHLLPGDGPGWLLRQAVRILLECILVLENRIAGQMGLSPVQPVIQPVTIDTMLN